MSWQKINIEDARINMSKVVPYDPSMTLLEEKQGYFHNNRLTALRRYATSGMPGYKCYKREKNPNHPIDGEITDYIEINKVVDGELVPLMEISDSYYRCVSEDYEGEGAIPDFYSGVILDNTLIGSQQDWFNTTFYKVTDHQYIAWHRDSNQVDRLRTYQKKSSNYNDNRGVEYLGQADTLAIFYKNDCIFVFPKDQFNKLWEETVSEDKSDFKKGFGKGSAALTTRTVDGIFFSLSNLNPIVGATLGNNYTTLNKDIYISYSGGLIWLLRLSIIETKSYIPPHTYTYRHFNIVDGNGNNSDTNDCLINDSEEPEYLKKPIRLTLTVDKKSTSFSDDSLSLNAISCNILVEQQSYISEFWETRIKVEDIPLAVDKSSYQSDTTILNANYVSDTKQIDNGFVVNYTNKQQVSLGHRYKTIARLDTQGASFLGSDSKYVYIRQNGNNYKIWIDKMFPDTPYNSEVNIIENGDLCQRVGGYKIFNTTTYYNAIYNDDPSKICCSCDDWNGRYFSTTRAAEEPTLLSTSRVGHFWNSTSSFDNIPAKAISSELTDQFEYAHPEYSWVNPSYTIHEGTTAYIYTSESTQIDRKIQQWEITSSGIRQLKDESKIYAHNPLYQIVPSILFSNTLKSDAIYALQVGSEVHLLKQYQYSQTTPALVYDDEATAVNIDPSARYMILQGAFYTSAGADDSIRIYNPYDTMMFEGVKTYCCDVTGLRYLGYDTTQAYYYSPATGIIYTFNGANKLNKFLEVDKREPLASGVIASGHVGIDICNIPSMNIIGMAFNDGVLLIINGQSVFIDAQNVQTLEANKELGLIKINSDYYYFGTNSLAANIGTTVADEAIELKLKTVKIGADRLNNQTIPKHRIVVWSDTVNEDTKAEVRITLTSRLGDKIYTETHTKTLNRLDLVENEFQWEFNPKQTKSNYIQVAVSLMNADLLDYYMDINDGSEENLVRDRK